jgi:ABC-type arginine transport system ATPase subunit
MLILTSVMFLRDYLMTIDITSLFIRRWLSLSKVVETIILEDEGSVALQKRVVELEEMNVQLEVSNAEMELTVSRSSEAITLLRRQLDEQLENYELLRLGNASLLEKRIEAQYRANELESELAEV